MKSTISPQAKTALTASIMARTLALIMLTRSWGSVGRTGRSTLRPKSMSSKRIRKRSSPWPEKPTSPPAWKCSAILPSRTGSRCGRRPASELRPVKKEPGSVKAQIDFLKGRKIHIHPSCVNTLKEIQQWKWKKDATTGLYIDEPVEFMDDAMQPCGMA